MDDKSQLKARIEQEAERESQRRRLREEAIVNQTFQEFPSKFKVAPGEVLKALGGSVRFDADGAPVVNSRPLKEALSDYVAVNGHAVAQSVAEIHDKGASSVRSKSQLVTPKEKADYVSTFGLAAFERLPLTAPQPIDPDTLDWETYRKLPVSAKVKLVETHGEGFAAKLQQREQAQRQYARLIGVPAEKRRA
jgi:hypothetical protein